MQSGRMRVQLHYLQVETGSQLSLATDGAFAYAARAQPLWAARTLQHGSDTATLIASRTCATGPGRPLLAEILTCH